MVELDLDSLNQRLPYPIFPYICEGAYSLITAFDVRYTIYFMPDESLISDDTYQFIISNVSNKPSPKDKKLRDTILEILFEFFRLNNHTVLYFCDTGDGKQALRDRLFRGWAEKAMQKGGFAFISSIVYDEEGNQNFVALISRPDNPNLGAIVQEFNEYISSINKPQE
ncbi:MAG: DUF6169 family protein [Bacteroidales bacterium]|nr:DUF6169 family protein [Bacteroidales bacterium]